MPFSINTRRFFYGRVHNGKAGFPLIQAVIVENGGLANTKAERRYKKGENPAYRPPAGKRFDGKGRQETI